VRVGWTRLGILAGSSACWPSWVSRCDRRSGKDQGEAREEAKTDRQDAQLLLKLFPAWNISACNARPATKYASWITWDLTL